MRPTPYRLFKAVDATWPAYDVQIKGLWTLRFGKGGGKRVSAATCRDSAVTDTDIELAKKWMIERGQTPLFMLRPQDQKLDTMLQEDGFAVIDPVVILGRGLDTEENPVTADYNAKPTDQQIAIWAKGGIGEARLAVMARATGRKCYIMVDGAATAFAAIDNKVCMVHAVEVLAENRRQGLGRKIMQAASWWARAEGSEFVSVLTVMQNNAATTLYRSLGYEEWAQYHYRIRP